MKELMFGELLGQHLSHADRSQAWLAKRLEVSPSTVNRWCNEEVIPKLETVVRMADVLNLHGQARQELLEVAGYTVSIQAEPPSDTPPASPSPTGEPPPAGSVAQKEEPKLLQALRERGEAFWNWIDLPDHYRGNWLAMLFYVPFGIIGHLTPQLLLVSFIYAGIWFITDQLVSPLLSWPMRPSTLPTLLILFSVAFGVVPLLLSLTVHVGTQESLQLPSVTGRFMVWLMEFVGAALLFLLLLVVFILAAAAWYLIFSSPLGELPKNCLVTLIFVGMYVGARYSSVKHYRVEDGVVYGKISGLRDLLFVETLFVVASILSLIALPLLLRFFTWPIFLGLIVLILSSIALYEGRHRSSKPISDKQLIILLGILFPLLALLFVPDFWKRPDEQEIASYLFWTGILLVVFSGSFLVLITAAIRNPGKIVTLEGASGLLLGACAIVFLALFLGASITNLLVIALFLVWLVWGRKRLRQHIDVHPAALVVGWAWWQGILALSARLFPLYLIGYAIVVPFLVAWAYRKPVEPPADPPSA